MKFAFVADAKLLIDAHLVPVAAIGYNAKSQKYTTMGCGLGE